MVNLGKLVILGGWIILFILGFRQATRKQNRMSDYGGGGFYFLGSLWAFASFILYLSIYRGVEELNLTRSFQNQKTAYVWRTYRNEQLWIRLQNQQEYLITILPPVNQGCQNLGWLEENTLVLLLKTETGIFQQTDPQNSNKQQFFSLWSIQAKPKSTLEPVSPEILQSLRKLIQEKPEQLGADLENFKVLAEEYEFSNMEKILNSEENPRMDAYVASVIGDLEGKKALPLLMKTLQKKEKQVSIASFEALLRLKTRHKEIPYLLYTNNIHMNKEFESRFQLLQVFGESEDARLIEPLIAWMGNEEELLDYRKEALVQLQKLTKKTFEYDFSERRFRQNQQLQEIQQWYDKEKATLLAPYPTPTPEITTDPKTTPEIATDPKTTPEIATDPKTTPEITTDPKTTPEIATDPKTTPEITTDPKTTPEITTDPKTTPVEPQNTAQKSLSVADLLSQEILWNHRETEMKELFWKANQQAFQAPLLVNTAPGAQMLPIKKDLKEALKRYLARSIWSANDKQMILKVLANFQKSTLVLSRIAAHETLQEWAKEESLENQKLIQSLMLPLREEDR